MLAKKPSIRLMRGVDVRTVADRSRSALLEFLNGVDAGWGKRELAQWLVGPYHELSILRLSGASVARPVSGVFPRSSSSAVVRENDLTRVMREAQEQALGIIARFENRDPRVDGFLWRLQARGIFVRVADESGAVGLLPNEVVSQRLAERVLSLVAVDYVSRPFDYEDRVAICRVCGDVTFREGARIDGDCGKHAADRSGPQLRMDSPSSAPEIEFQELDMESDDIDDLEVMRLVAGL